jgi:Carotenoid biosynthesis protein
MALLFSTIALRPYVFLFLAAYLVASMINFGVLTTLAFSVAAWSVALLCEWSSIRDGFPFGLYHYHHATYGHEIWLLGVPFFDPLSFVFLSFASYSMALLLTAPLYRRRLDLRILDTWGLRRSLQVWGLGAMLMVMVDLVVDPLSVRGSQWFLGNVFWYDPPGPYFGVPITNFLGWLFVAAINIAIFQMLDRFLNRGGEKPLGVIPDWPSRALLGPLLYAGMAGFGIVMLFAIHAPAIAWASVFIYLPFCVLAVSVMISSRSRGDREAILRHLHDFPFNSIFAFATKASASRSQRA